MSVEAKIVGFDRLSERIGVEVDIPPAALPSVKQIAAVPTSDSDLFGSYPLDEHQIALIAETAHLSIDPVKFTYFLEAYDE